MRRTAHGSWSSDHNAVLTMVLWLWLLLAGVTVCTAECSMTAWLQRRALSTLVQIKYLSNLIIFVKIVHLDED